MKDNLRKIISCFFIGVFLFLGHNSLVMGYTSDSEAEQLRQSEQKDIQTREFLSKAKAKEERLHNWKRNLKSENYIVKRLTISALGYYKVRSAVPYLKKIIDNPTTLDRQGEIDTQAIQALGEIGGKEATDFLISKIKDKKISPDKDPRTFHYVFESLRRMPSSEAVEIFFPYLTHANPRMRTMAAGAMGALAQGNNIVVFHYRGTAQGHEPVYQDPDKFKSVVDKEKVGPVLIQLLSDKEGNVRASAASSLGLIRYKKAVPYLEKLLGDPYTREVTQSEGGSPPKVIQVYSVREAAKRSLRILSERYLKEFEANQDK